jgi:single-strand DNA-binding protein
MTNKTKGNIANTAATRDQQESIFLVGNIGADPELRQFESGKAVARFSLAINGKDKTTPQWINVEGWDKIAAFMVDACHKGKRVAIKGYFEVQEYFDKAGEAKTKEVFKAIYIDRCVTLQSKIA